MCGERRGERDVRGEIWRSVIKGESGSEREEGTSTGVRGAGGEWL